MRNSFASKNLFLASHASYIVKKRWMDSGGPVFDAAVDDEDEEAVEKQDEFEIEYNFRYEEK